MPSAWSVCHRACAPSAAPCGWLAGRTCVAWRHGLLIPPCPVLPCPAVCCCAACTTADSVHPRVGQGRRQPGCTLHRVPGRVVAARWRHRVHAVHERHLRAARGRQRRCLDICRHHHLPRRLEPGHVHHPGDAGVARGRPGEHARLRTHPAASTCAVQPHDRQSASMQSVRPCLLRTVCQRRLPRERRVRQTTAACCLPRLSCACTCAHHRPTST
jgi:hypothetical protein